jgi:putative effector of murein hydrolase
MEYLVSLPVFGIILTMLPKSVTAAIAMELSINKGGLRGLAVSAVIVTGIISALLAPFFIKTFKLKDPVAVGIAMGASGHIISTATALELGEIQGAAGGIAITLMGIITSIILFF